MQRNSNIDEHPTDNSALNAVYDSFRIPSPIYEKHIKNTFSCYYLHNDLITWIGSHPTNLVFFIEKNA